MSCQIFDLFEHYQAQIQRRLKYTFMCVVDFIALMQRLTDTQAC